MIEKVVSILRDALQLSEATVPLGESSQLLGAIPEFDSMAVVTVLTMVEEEFGVEIDDDEVSADIFETVGTLADFVTGKVND